MLKLAERILQSRSTDFDTSRFVDRYEKAVVEMLSKKQAGLPVSREHAPARPRGAVNLMEALRRQHCTGKPSTALQKRPRRIDGQGEMLLRIAGKKGKQTTAKPAERASARQENAG